MRRLLLASAGLLFTTMAVNATQINFSVSDNTGFNTSLSCTSPGSSVCSFSAAIPGLTVTATPYTDFGSGFVTGTGANGSTIQEFSSLGLGVCNSSEEPSCVLPDHQVDNVSGDDFILLHFSIPVTFLDVVLKNVGAANSGAASLGANMDVTYYTCNGIGTVVGVAAGSAIAGCAAPLNNSSGGVQANNTAYTRLTQSTVITDLLIGAQVGDSVSDFFKLEAVDVTAASVPEPATFALMGGALLALAGIRFRRKG
jgi:hypothetical protein